MKLSPCKICGAKTSQVISNCGGKGKTKWTVYCNSCGRGDAEYYGESEAKAINAWQKGNTQEMEV